MIFNLMVLIIVVYFPYALGLDGNVILRNLGEKQYEMVKAKSSLPMHGSCWSDALKTIKSSCDNLRDHEHSVLAIKLANCFLQDSGLDSADCDVSTQEERRECIKQMPDRAFGVYNEFYTHAVHMCFFLNYEAWQNEIDNTVKQLYQVSSRMKEQLLEASELQGAMLESQKEGLKVQNELLDHGKELGVVLKTSSETVNSMVSDFKESAKDQRELLHKIFSYVHTFQSWILGEVSWVQTILYYLVSCILCALFSSSRRTADARVILLTILSLNVVTERMLVQYYTSFSHQPLDEKESLIEATWLYRKISLVLCAITLFCTYYNYKDEHIENYHALKRIEHQLDTIQKVTTISNNKNPVRYATRLAIKRMQLESLNEKASDNPE